MTSVKVPVLVTKYAEDIFTARVVDGPDADAAGTSASEAFSWVRDYLRKQGMREPDQYWPRIDSFELNETSVRVRLYYRDENRQFPASRELKLPVRYVLGHYVDKSVECFLTDFDVVFHCPAIRELPKLIEESVRGATAQIDSRELLAATPPADSELRVVRVKLRDVEDRKPQHNTETLSTVASPIDVRQRKQKSAPLKHRDNEVAQVLSGMIDSSLILVGPSGCGKSTVVRLASQLHQTNARQQAKIDGDRTPPPLVWESSAENLIAGMQYLGEWEQRLEQVISELESISGILSFTSLVDLVRLGGSQPTDSLAAFLLPYIRRREVRVIAEATHEELDAARRLLPGWVECFQIVNVPTLTHDQTRDIAETMLSGAGRNHRIEIEESAAETVTRLFAQFMPYQSPPRGTVELIGDLIQQTLDDSSTQTWQQQNGADQQDTRKMRIAVGDIVDRFTKLTGLPEAMLRDSVTLSAESVRDSLRQSVIGQDSAVDSASNTILRLKAGLCDPGRPVATMLFCGPTGVGKTQLARSLADYLFGHTDLLEKTIVRLDMSEYGSWDAVDRFLMEPSGEVAAWIARLRARPMSVLLLDEFEKASTEVHDCLLSALDEGRLTDRFGRTTTLCGSIIIMTSNVGAKSSASIGFTGEDNRALQRAIEQEFRPEFLNRLDEVVTFDALPADVIEKIVEKELESLQQRETLTDKRVTLVWDDSVVKRIAAVGFDPLLGARPLQRVIEQEVVAKIARRLLAIDGDQPLVIDLKSLVEIG